VPTVADITERELIERVRRTLSPPPSWMVVGIGDDAAVVEPERNHLQVLTVDAVVEGVHFDRAFTPADAIGHRALAVNLSDLAAMGAVPWLALLSMALPAALPLDDFDAMISGISALAGLHGVHLAGGNLTRSPGPLVLDVTAVGSVKRRQVLTRCGARAGDDLYVTGIVGAAAAGLQYCRSTHAAPAPSLVVPVRHALYPTPRVRAGVLAARNRAATACMDLSDGLSDAVQQVTRASGVGARIEAGTLPIDAGARVWFEQRGQDPILEALRGGDDYELLFAVPPRRRRRFLAAMTLSGTPVTRIGQCTPDRAVHLEGHSASTPLPAGFSHFR
jgi:thiamine-monophosphate kinase